MSTIYDWSIIAGDNATADTSINWAEGQFPSTVNNSARQMMARVAQWIDDNGVLTVTGTNTIAVTTNSPIAAITTGMTLSFRAVATNTTAVTLNVNGLGGQDIRKVTAGGTDSVALAAGDINIKGIYVVVYDATTNGGAGGWILLNPAGTAYLPLTGGTLTGSLTIESTDAGAGTGPNLSLYRNSASPAASDNLGQISFHGEDSVGNQELYGYMRAQITDPVSGSEDGRVVVGNVVAGVATDRIALNATGVDLTGAVAVNGNTSVTGNISATGTATITGNASALAFISTNFNSPAGSVVLSSTAVGVFFRPNGSASAVGEANINTSGALTLKGRIVGGDGTGPLALRPDTSTTANQSFIDTSGNFTASGNVTAFSDLRLKTKVRSLDDTAAIIDAIEAKRYELKADGRAGVGFIAQDIQAYLPELIVESEDEDKTLSLAYGNLTAVLWNEIRDLRKRLATLEGK